MSIYPTELERLEPDQLRITWSDGQRRLYTVSELRKNCPCATCRDERQAAAEAPEQVLPVVDLAATQPLRVDQMAPVGNYAYGLTFSDGHDTGIYSWNYLREIEPRDQQPDGR